MIDCSLAYNRAKIVVCTSTCCCTLAERRICVAGQVCIAEISAAKDEEVITLVTDHLADGHVVVVRTEEGGRDGCRCGNRR